MKKNDSACYVNVRSSDNFSQYFGNSRNVIKQAVSNQTFDEFLQQCLLEINNQFTYRVVNY